MIKGFRIYEPLGVREKKERTHPNPGRFHGSRLFSAPSDWLRRVVLFVRKGTAWGHVTGQCLPPSAPLGAKSRSESLQVEQRST